MPLDVQKTVYDRVWELLEGYPPFAQLVENRIKANERGNAREDQLGRAPQDFPKVVITVGEDTTGERGPVTFSDECDYGVPMTLVIEIKIVHDGDALDDETPVEAAVRGALLKGRRNLGIDWVGSVVDRGTKRSREVVADFGKQLRTVTRRRLTVNARPLHSLLTAL